MVRFRDLVVALGVVTCVGIAIAVSVLKLHNVLGVFDARADNQASFGYAERAHTYEGWSPAGGEVLEDARLWMPENARYRVVFAPGYDRRGSQDFTRDLLLAFLLPRRPTTSENAKWLFCYGCDAKTLGERYEVLASVPGGPTFGRLTP